MVWQSKETKTPYQRKHNGSLKHAGFESICLLGKEGETDIPSDQVI